MEQQGWFYHLPERALNKCWNRNASQTRGRALWSERGGASDTGKGLIQCSELHLAKIKMWYKEATIYKCLLTLTQMVLRNTFSLVFGRFAHRLVIPNQFRATHNSFSRVPPLAQTETTIHSCRVALKVSFSRSWFNQDNYFNLSLNPPRFFRFACENSGVWAVNAAITWGKAKFRLAL